MDTICPPPPNLADLPTRVDRNTGARLLSRYYFTISPRTLERWPVSWRRLNGKAHAETAELFRVADFMLADAPAVMGVRRAATEQQQA